MGQQTRIEVEKAIYVNNVHRLVRYGVRIEHFFRKKCSKIDYHIWSENKLIIDSNIETKLKINSKIENVLKLIS